MWNQCGIGRGLLLVLAMAGSAMAQSLPTTRPIQGGVDADRVLNQLLQTPTGGVRPLQPSVPETETTDVASTRNAVAPSAEAVRLQPEGSMLSQRIGRLQNITDGKRWELHFEADGRALQDPPMMVLPNLKLAGMEQQVKQSGRDLRFRVTGVITEYGGRNYVLIEKYEVVADTDRAMGQ